MVAEDSLFRSIGRNRGSTKLPHMKDSPRRLTSLTNPPLFPKTQPADPQKTTSCSTLSKWETDHQNETTWAPHKILFGMDAKQIYQSLSSLVESCFCITQATSPGVLSLTHVYQIMHVTLHIPNFLWKYFSMTFLSIIYWILF